MRLVIQRVKRASVTVEGTITGKIDDGLLALVGIEDKDTPDDSQWLAGKLVNLRIFDDENGVMNRSVTDINGGILIVSQFTLMASTKKGNRPSYIRASKHEVAIPMYEQFCDNVTSLLGKPVQTGIFAADMQVELLNNGPVTIFIDSHLRE
ncbi:D-aminoacyl-tRNA deacylase [Paludibacter sp.]|uniref:D-aminoacyl-tRNA deacylase n=1 Tax=Paludibacter sp. TaxID=1898105 RepID=UPI001353D79E|nr:D-aminoacyl-tRNA deacylase [Paludibacter sp.]MTK51938.1 D-tyrosyl-tRNA(Tyr) deacylase [Paludibacter sp.]